MMKLPSGTVTRTNKQYYQKVFSILKSHICQQVITAEKSQIGLLPLEQSLWRSFLVPGIYI